MSLRTSKADPPEPAFPPLAAALRRWREADAAFARAASRGERGIAMLEQLRARGAVYRFSEIELLLGRPLRGQLVEEGIWSPREALGRLEAVDFSARAGSLRALAPSLPDDGLARALEMATRPGWGDDARWEIDEDLVQELTARVARGGSRDARPPSPAEEKREDLRRTIARHESLRLPWCDRFDGLLQIARRLHGPRRATVLRWALEEREKGRTTEMTVDLARAAALSEGQDRAALVGTIEAQLEACEAEEQLTVLTMLMAGASPAEAVHLARRGLGAMGGGETKIQDATAFLAAIPSPTWTALARTDWEPALGAGGFNGGWAGHLRWIPHDLALLSVPSLPDEARHLVEERGLPAWLGRDADDRLRVAAMSIQALSPAGRAALTAPLLALDAAAWRKAGSALGRVARALDEDDLERLWRTVRDAAPARNWWPERAIAEAWAARGRLDRTAALVDRIADDRERELARAAVAVMSRQVTALPPKLDPRVVYLVLDHTPNELVSWSPEARGSDFADALATRLDEESSAPACLRIWAALWPALSASTRAELGPRVARAVDVVLAEDGRDDDALCAITASLPERLLERIWIARASATAHRHAVEPYERRFGEFMIAGEYHHPGVLHFVQTLGGDDALFDYARWLAGIA